ncbi:WD40 repeat domain-containing protein [Calidithermus terrae]|nr:WD40 repeat domain-containing protein [Calidithermus terrae]
MIRTESGELDALVFGQDSKRIYAVQRRAIVAYDAATLRESFRLANSSYPPYVYFPSGVRATSDPNVLVYFNRAGEVSVWDVARQKVARRLEGHSSKVAQVSFSRDGRQVISRYEGSRVRRFDLATGRYLGEEDQRKMPGGDATFYWMSQDGSLVVTSGEFAATVQVLDTRTGRQVARIRGYMSTGEGMSFSADNRYLALGSGNVMVWDLHAGRPTVTLELANPDDGPVNAVAFTPDGRTLVVGQHQFFSVWDWATGRQIRRVQVSDSDEDWFGDLAVSPDGKMLAAAYGNQVLLFALEEGDTPLATLTGHTAAVSSVAFSPDGSRLVSGSEDGGALVWRLR